MFRLLLHWFISAICLLVVAHVVHGFYVRDLKSALIAALVIGLVNATLGLVLRVLTFPLTILTFGIFLLVINALMLRVAAYFVPGFSVTGFWPAFWGAAALALLNLVVGWIMPKKRDR